MDTLLDYYVAYATTAAAATNLDLFWLSDKHKSSHVQYRNTAGL